MNDFANAAPAKAAARDDDCEESNDNPHDNHPEFPQTFQTFFRWICHIIYDAYERIIRHRNNGRCFLDLSFYQIQQKRRQNRYWNNQSNTWIDIVAEIFARGIQISNLICIF